ncbi:MAG: DHA2 family efflux MFS transporter permease subunit [Actinomycetota bacterium]
MTSESPVTVPAGVESHARATLAVAALAALATYLDTTILFVAFPDITASFDDASPSTLSWVLNAYTIAFAALLVPAGKLADRLGHRRVFLTGSAVFTAASMACGFAPSVGLLIVARVAQGVGAAILIPASLALVMAAFPRERIPLVVAIWGAIGAFSAALGPSLGALIVDGLGWRWAFYLNLPIGIVTLIAGARLLSEHRSESVRLPSPVGVALVASAASALVYGVVESDTHGWLSGRTAIVLSIGFALLGTFIVHQRRTPAPTLDLDLFRLRNFRWGNVGMLSFSAGFSAMFFGLILFMVEVWNWSVLQAGFAIAPGPLVAALLAPYFGSLAGRIGQRPIVIGGGVLFAVAGLYRLAFLTEEVDYLVDFVVPLAMVSVSIPMVFPQVTSAAAQALPPHQVGVGGGTTQAIRQFGGSFGVAVAIALVGTTSGLVDALAGFDRVWWFTIGAGALTALGGLPLDTPRATDR